MSDTVTLAPCPFCGSTEAQAIDRTCDRDTPYNPADYAYPRVICRCGVQVPGENWRGKDTAIAAWNRRAASNPAPSGEAVPVAWRVRERYPMDPELDAAIVKRGRWRYHKDKPEWAGLDNTSEAQPLYAAPPSPAQGVEITDAMVERATDALYGTERVAGRVITMSKDQARATAKLALTAALSVERENDNG